MSWHSDTPASRDRRRLRWGAATSASSILCVLLTFQAQAQTSVPEAPPDLREPITIVADSIRSWMHDGVRILLLKGNVYIAQGLTRIRAPRAVAWIQERGAQASGLIQAEIYAEGHVRVRGPGQQQDLGEFLGRLETRAELVKKMRQHLSGSAVDDPLYRRGEARRTGTASVARQIVYEESPLPIPVHSAPGRHLRFFPRSSRPFQFQTVRLSPEEQAVVFTGGVNLIIDNVEGVGTVDILADRMVWWTQSLETQGIAKQETTQPPDAPLEVYLEGNVVVRQGERTFESTDTYYDVNRHIAVANNAKLETISRGLRAPIFFRARKLRQVDKNKFVAEHAQVTPSRFPIPTYEIRAERATLEDTAMPITNLLGDTAGSDQEARLQRSQRRVTGVDSYFLFQEMPLLYWPYIEGSIEDFNTPLRSIQLGQSRSFGTEVLTTWDMFRLLGWEQPGSVRKWDMDLDYLSKRGPAIGNELQYRGLDLLGTEGPYWGLVDTYWIHDTGEDRLGRRRMDVEPEQEFRGRFLLRHRQLLPEDFSLTLELAWITDINFLEQYFEGEWEEDKDQETLVYLKQQRDNWAWSILTRGRILDFVTTTDYLPRLDYYLLGEPLFGNRLSYFGHSSLAYMDLLRADRSIGDIAVFPDVPAVVGSRLDTLHELDWPCYFGPVRVVPYLMGRVSSWSRTIDLGDETRLYGAAGTRASMPLWRVYPGVESQLLNLYGLAHKIVFNLDYSVADSDVDFTSLPEYDELEEDAEQVFRQRFLFRDFAALGIPFPDELDPRRYAIRTGLLTHPEAVDDLHVLRFGVRQRLQTKRGIVGHRRVIDWMILDLGAALFPNEDRDNFGQEFGQLNYDYEWYLGDRTSLLSDGWFDTFGDGPRMWNIGLFMERPPRGSLYVGYTSLEPIGSRVARASYNYYMSPKWVSSLVTIHDFGESDNLGQSLVLTRIGADLVFRVGLKYNPLRDDFGVGVQLVPRIAPQLGLGGGNFRGTVPVDFAPVE